jgi:hypothetical protein
VGSGADGASVNNGIHGGVATLLRHDIFYNKFIHCTAHKSALAMKGAATALDPIMAAVDKLASDLPYFINISHKRLERLQEIYRELLADPTVIMPKLLRYNATRWLSRRDAFRRLVLLWHPVLIYLKEIKKNVGNAYNDKEVAEATKLYGIMTTYTTAAFVHFLADCLTLCSLVQEGHQSDYKLVTDIEDDTGYIKDELTRRYLSYNLADYVDGQNALEQGLEVGTHLRSFLDKTRLDAAGNPSYYPAGAAEGKRHPLRAPSSLEIVQRKYMYDGAAVAPPSKLTYKALLVCRDYAEKLKEKLNEYFGIDPLIAAFKIFTREYNMKVQPAGKWGLCKEITDGLDTLLGLYGEKKDVSYEDVVDGYKVHLSKPVSGPLHPVGTDKYAAILREMDKFLEELRTDRRAEQSTLLFLAHVALHGRQAYPNLWRLIAILLALPTQTACAERGFSIVKWIKDRLQGSMSADTLDAKLRIYFHGRIRHEPKAATARALFSGGLAFPYSNEKLNGNVIEAAVIWDNDPTVQHTTKRMKALKETLVRDADVAAAAAAAGEGDGEDEVYEGEDPLGD